MKLKLEEIATGVYVASAFPDVNLGLILVDGGAVAVDAPALPADARTWREQVCALAAGPIRYTILTDHHPDRAFSAGLLGAPIVAGRETLRLLREAGEEYRRAAIEEWRQQGFRETPGPGDHRLALPDAGVAGRIILHTCPQVVVETVAGAAPGSIWILLPQQGVLFAGDTIVTATHPLLGSAPDTGAWLETLVTVRRSRFPASIIVPGRGPVGDHEQTHPLSEYIQLVRRRIRSLHRAGRSRNGLAGLVGELLAAFPVTDADQDRTQRRIRSGLERVYAELRPDGAAP